jgi:hypothetical protein
MNKPLTREEWMVYLDTTWKECLHKAWDKELDSMNDDIIRMAREAGAEFAELPMGDAWVFSEEGQLQCFATLVAKEVERKASFDRADIWLKRINAAVLAEREACANIAENWNCNGAPRVGVAAQIRARGTHEN